MLCSIDQTPNDHFIPQDDIVKAMREKRFTSKLEALESDPFLNQQESAIVEVVASLDPQSALQIPNPNSQEQRSVVTSVTTNEGNWSKPYIHL